PAAAVIALALGMVVLVLVLVSREVRRAAAAPPASAPESGGAPPSAASLQPSAEHLHSASELARARPYAEALRLLYAASPALPPHARMLRLDPSRTNGHYLQSLPPGPTREHFALFTQLFEQSWYGKQPASRADYELAERCVELLRSGSQR